MKNQISTLSELRESVNPVFKTARSCVIVNALLGDKDAQKLMLLQAERNREIMNIQIFGTKKSADTRKAERFFKERGIKYQYIDLKEKGLSKGEFQSVLQAVGSLDAMIDKNCKDEELLALIRYIVPEDRIQKVLENQIVLKQPIVRNGRQATIGYAPDIWKDWN